PPANHHADGCDGERLPDNGLSNRSARDGGLTVSTDFRDNSREDNGCGRDFDATSGASRATANEHQKARHHERDRLRFTVINGIKTRGTWGDTLEERGE